LIDDVIDPLNHINLFNICVKVRDNIGFNLLIEMNIGFLKDSNG